LLVDGKVYERGYVGEDVETVLEADSQVVFGGFGAQEVHIVDCVSAFQVEAVVILLGVVSYLSTLRKTTLSSVALRVWGIGGVEHG
jgi:hypothetical protein